MLNSENVSTGLYIIPARPPRFIIRREKLAGHAQTILLGGHSHGLRSASREVHSSSDDLPSLLSPPVWLQARDCLSAPGPMPDASPLSLCWHSRLIRFAVLLRLPGFALARRTQHFVAAARDLVHPHHVHDVQADAGADPGDSATPGHQVKGFRAVDGVHAAVVDRHDSDADHEKHRRHGDAVRHIWPRGLGVPKHFEEPAETQHGVNNEGSPTTDAERISGNLTR